MNEVINMFKNIITIPLLLIFNSSLFSFIYIEPAIADTVSNDNYTIDVNNIDTNPMPTPKKEVLGTNNIRINDYTTGPNYTVKAAGKTFTLELSQNTIDYGILSSSNPVIRTSNILLNDDLLGGEVLSYENHPLIYTNNIIPNTSCDNGACSPEIAAIWNNALTYGFGYRCDSSQVYLCDSQFSSVDYYKPYSDNSIFQTSEPVIVTGKGKSQATITYKVNISGTQKSGSYYNSITYLAIPNF